MNSEVSYPGKQKTLKTKPCVVACIRFYFKALLQAVRLLFIPIKMNILWLMVIFPFLTFSEQIWMKNIFAEQTFKEIWNANKP